MSNDTNDITTDTTDDTWVGDPDLWTTSADGNQTRQEQMDVLNDLREVVGGGIDAYRGQKEFMTKEAMDKHGTYREAQNEANLNPAIVILKGNKVRYVIQVDTEIPMDSLSVVACVVFNTIDCDGFILHRDCAWFNGDNINDLPPGVRPMNLIHDGDPRYVEGIITIGMVKDAGLMTAFQTYVVNPDGTMTWDDKPAIGRPFEEVINTSMRNAGKHIADQRHESTPRSLMDEILEFREIIGEPLILIHPEEISDEVTEALAESGVYVVGGGDDDEDEGE